MIVDRPGRTVAVVGLLTALALGALTGLRVDNRWSVFLPDGDPRVERYERFRATFGEDSFLLALGNPGATPQAVDEVRRQLADVDGVGRVAAPGSGPLASRLRSGERPAWWVEARPELDPLARVAVVARVRTVLDAHDASRPARIAGPEAVNYYLDRGSFESFSRLFPLTILLMAIVLLSAIGDARLVAAVLVTAAVAAAGTLALVRLAGVALNMVTIVLPALILVLTTAYSLHQLTCFLSADGAPPDRWRAASARTWRPCALTVVTTAGGFGALALSDLPPIRQLGLFAAAGLLLSFALVYTLLPALALLLGATRHSAPPPAFPGLRRPALALPIVALALLVTAAAASGIRHLRVESHVLGFFPSGHPLATAMAEAEAGWFGQTPLEIWIRGERSALSTPEGLRSLIALEDALTDLDGATTVISPLDASPSLRHLPASWAARLLRAALSTAATTPEASKILRLDGETLHLRLTVAMRTLGNEAFDERVEAARAIATRLAPPGTTVEVTGAIPILARIQVLLLRTQLTSFTTAFAVVTLILVIAFRSLLLGAISLVPNLMPIAITVGAMGWLGIPLDVATVTVAGIALGLVVDDTIHLLHRYRDARQSGAPPPPPLHPSQTTTRPAHHKATAALALLCDLIVLPALLLIGTKPDPAPGPGTGDIAANGDPS